MSPKPQRRTGAQQGSRQPAGKASSGKAGRPRAKGKKALKGPAAAAAQPTRTGIPDEASVTQAFAGLSAADQQIVRGIVARVAEHLGSPEAARLWLVTPAPECGTAPLAAVAAGRADLVLAVLESRWGPSPDYA